MYFCCPWRLRKTCGSSVETPASGFHTCSHTILEDPPLCKPKTKKRKWMALLSFQNRYSQKVHMVVMYVQWEGNCSAREIFDMIWMINMKVRIHLSGFTYEVVSPHQGADGHLEEVASAGVLGDAAEGMHDKQLLKGLEHNWGSLKCNVLPTKTSLIRRS